MFGLGKGDRLIKELNNRNKYCAQPLHSLATPIYKTSSGLTSEQTLIDDRFVSVLNEDIGKTSAALATLDRGEVAASIIIQHLEINNAAASKMLKVLDDNNDLIEFSGSLCAAGTCQRLIFGVAPAFSNDQQEIMVHTLSLLKGLRQSAESLLIVSSSFKAGYVRFVSLLEDEILTWHR